MRLLEDGQIIRDTYEVERFLGEGAFAEVYRVRHRFLGRQAMKVFKQTGMSVEEVNDLLGEAVLLSRIGHPNIVRVFDANVIESASGIHGYFTMENVSGGTLEKYRASHRYGLVPVATTLDLIKQVCRGIARAHSESPPIIHRDIKPQNILVGNEGDALRARVSDFGLAKKANPLTLMATGAGTLAFKPPEVFARWKSDSCAADVWAIGTTLYFLLTGRLPYPSRAQTTWEMPATFHETYLPPSSMNPDVNPFLDDIVKKSLEFQPEDRYATAGEFLEALEKWRPGAVAPENGHDAGSLVADALKARQAGRLGEAARLMEEAFTQSPGLKTKYAREVDLWRRGIAM